MLTERDKICEGQKPYLYKQEWTIGVYKRHSLTRIGAVSVDGLKKGMLQLRDMWRNSPGSMIHGCHWKGTTWTCEEHVSHWSVTEMADGRTVTIEVSAVWVC